jgi:hypothetical protein
MHEVPPRGPQVDVVAIAPNDEQTCLTPPSALLRIPGPSAGRSPEDDFYGQIWDDVHALPGGYPAYADPDAMAPDTWD